MRLIMNILITLLSMASDEEYSSSLLIKALDGTNDVETEYFC